jgi:hypothetical protein
MGRKSRPLPMRELSLARRPWLLAEGIGIREARLFQRLHDLGQAFRNAVFRLFLSDLCGKSDDKAETILPITKLGLCRQPIPIHIRVLQWQPRERLDDTRIEIGSIERVEEKLGRIPRLTLEVSVSGIAEFPWKQEAARERHARVLRLSLQPEAWQNARRSP